MLFLEGLVDRLAHVDLTLRVVGLGVIDGTPDQGFADQDLTPLEVHVAPLESVDLSRAHPGEEANGQIGLVICAHGLEQQAHFLHGERLDVDLGLLESLDLCGGFIAIEAIGGFRQDLPQKLDRAIDGFRCQRGVAVSTRDPSEADPKLQDVLFGDLADFPVSKGWDQVSIEGGPNGGGMGAPPGDLGFRHPVLDELLKQRSIAIGSGIELYGRRLGDFLGVLAAREPAFVVKLPQRDLRLDLVQGSFHLLAVGWSVRQRRLFAASNATKAKLKKTAVRWRWS